MARKLPIQKLVMPSTLARYENGKLPDHLLVKIGVGNARMEMTAARSFVAMFAEASRTLGVQLRHVGDYRPYDAQLRLFLDRYEPVTLAVYGVTSPSHRKKWDAGKTSHGSAWWRKKKRADGSYPATAATPGASNHGWGLAIDIAEEYDNDPQPDPIRDIFVSWLVGNAHRYGISAELQSEPWHWRYVTGDAIPQATREFERNGGVVPPTVVAPPNVEPGPALVFAYPGEPIKRGSKHTTAVKLIQAVVGATPDGDFGAVTERRVKVWQASRGLVADGVVAPITWKAMFG